jgi:hypothetical protein
LGGNFGWFTPYSRTVLSIQANSLHYLGRQFAHDRQFRLSCLPLALCFRSLFRGLFLGLVGLLIAWFWVTSSCVSTRSRIWGIGRVHLSEKNFYLLPFTPPSCRQSGPSPLLSSSGPRYPSLSQGLINGLAFLSQDDFLLSWTWWLQVPDSPRS